MALKELRDASRGWIAGIFVGLLVISFAVWGVADIFGTRASRGVARVGSTWISIAEFQQRFRAELENFRQQTGQQLTAEQASIFGLNDRVLQFLIDVAAVEEMGRRLGLAAHDDTVKSEIISTSAFQGIDGRFDNNTYRRVLREYGYTPTTYEESLRGDIVREQMVRAVREGTILPRGYVETLIRHNAERRQVSYVLVQPEIVDDPPVPTDEQLQEFIAGHFDQFSTPELRSFVAIVLMPNDFTDDVTLSEEELIEQYEFDIARYTVPERRSIRSIAFASETEAKTAFERLKAGETFDAVGKERGLDAQSLAFSWRTKAEIIDSAVAESAFAAAEPGYIGPIDGDLAWSVVEIDTIEEEKVRAFKDVKDELRTYIAQNRSVDLLYEIVNAIEDSRAEGQTLEEIASRLNLRLVRAQKIDREGKSLDGKSPLAGIDENSGPILEQAFLSEEGLENDFQQGANGSQFVLRVDAIDEPRLKELEDTRDEAIAVYTAAEKRKMIQARSQELLLLAQEKGGLSGIAAEIGSTVVKLNEPIGRQAQNDILAPSLIEDLFVSTLGDLVIGRVPDSDSWVIAELTDVVGPNSQEVATGVTQVAPQLDQASSSNIASQYVGGLRRELGVKIDRSAVEAAALNVQY